MSSLPGSATDLSPGVENPDQCAPSRLHGNTFNAILGDFGGEFEKLNLRGGQNSVLCISTRDIPTHASVVLANVLPSLKVT